tara:strand:+ start:226 stop:456 length:231 start_codon:yes stop_codon:yes gene_type:complete
MLKTFRNKKAFQRANESANDDEIVCGTLIDDKPVYFTMPKDSTEDEVRARAFEVRTGRSMSKIEETLLSIAETTSR